MLSRTVLAAAIVLGTILPVAAAPPMCGPSDSLTAELKSKFGEVPKFQATMGDKKQPVTITVSPDGSWTVFVTPEPGFSCLIGTGANWVTAPAASIEPRLEPNGLTNDELLRWGRGSYLRTF